MAVLILTVLWLVHATAVAQSIDDIHYDIDVTLDDEAHILIGKSTISFRNSTGEQLSRACVHLYPNAYSSTQTAFARQRHAYGYSDFDMASEDERGYLRLGEVFSDYSEVRIYTDKDDPDVAWMRFDEPVEHGDSVRVSIDFEVKIPKSFSRLGRVGQSYQVSQWFPKLAMYDEDGWHPQPYLDIGEFYSAFADYDVAITLPDNYIVGATGILQDEVERQNMQLMADTANLPLAMFPESSRQMKTLHYKARDVHDFAWFADKRFAVRMDTVCIDERCIDVVAYFTAINADRWENATDHMREAVRFFSAHVGPYPYPVVSAVESPLSAGTGMEYPMITLIGFETSDFSLDRVLAHEIGHNWFQGMLASNERAYPWLDEGLVSYYENRYILERYGELRDDFLPHLTKREGPIPDPLLLMSFDARRGLLQSPDTDPAKITEDNYFYGAYLKGAYAFRILEEWLGREVFDEAMQVYFTEWKFKHPKPMDLKQVLETHCNCSLNWLFEDLMSSEAMPDYSIVELDRPRKLLRLRNEAGVAAPLAIIIMESPDTTVTWLNGFRGDTSFTVDISSNGSISLYDGAYSLDSDTDDNYVYYNSKKQTSRPLKLTLLSGVNDPSRTLVNVFPAMGFNNYDRFMLGANVSNLYWPSSNLEYSITPLISFGPSDLVNSVSLSGMGDVRYMIYPKSRQTQNDRWESIEVGLEARSFYYNYDTTYGFRDRYLKWAPRVRLSLRPGPLSRYRHHFGFRFVSVHQFYGRGVDVFERTWEREQRNYYVNELNYILENRDPLLPSTTEVLVQQGKGFLRISAEHEHKFNYRKFDKGIYLRLFGGWLPVYNDADAYVPFLFNGTTSIGFFSKDYTYDEFMFGRNEGEGVLSQQVFLRDAQLKTLYQGGISDSWMSSVGVAADVPGPVPLQLYIDAAVYDDPFDEGVTFSYSAGVAIIAVQDAVEIYIPLLESSDIRNNSIYQERSFLERISFLFDLNEISPRKIKDVYFDQ